MTEDCLNVQEAISRAADGEQVTTDEAALAKRHCAECAQCAAFAKVLVAMRRNPAPSVSEQTVQDALTAVRELRQADKLEAARAVAASRAATTNAHVPTDADNMAGSDSPKSNTGRLISLSERDAHGAEVVRIGRRTISQQHFVGLFASAAVLLVVIVVAADQGIRFMDNANIVSEEMASGLRAVEDGEVIQAPLDAGENMAATSAPGVAGIAAQYVVFEGYAYRYVGTSSADPDDLVSAGTVRSALDTGNSPSGRDVYLGDSDSQIIVEGPDTLLSFTLVTRMLNGSVFTLASEPIGAFGQWPTLPDGTPEPSSPDGGATFNQVGTDDQGVMIFARPGRDVEDGFAIAPGTSAGDPAAGNPGWTWWEPFN